METSGNKASRKAAALSPDPEKKARTPDTSPTHGEERTSGESTNKQMKVERWCESVSDPDG